MLSTFWTRIGRSRLTLKIYWSVLLIKDARLQLIGKVKTRITSYLKELRISQRTNILFPTIKQRQGRISSRMLILLTILDTWDPRATIKKDFSLFQITTIVWMVIIYQKILKIPLLSSQDNIRSWRRSSRHSETLWSRVSISWEHLIMDSFNNTCCWVQIRAK